MTNKNFKNEPSSAAFHHLFYSFSLIFNFVTTIVYWPMLHTISLKIFAHRPYFIITNLYIVHSFPILVCLANSYLAPCVLSEKFIKPLLGVAVLYLSVNFA